MGAGLPVLQRQRPSERARCPLSSRRDRRAGTMPHPPADAAGRGQATSYMQRVAETFAIGTANRYAATTQGQFNSYQIHDAEPFRQGWIQTDRPLYRPSQVVNYRAILTEGLPDVYRPAVGTKARIEIRGPKGVVQGTDVTLDAKRRLHGNLHACRERGFRRLFHRDDRGAWAGDRHGVPGGGV